MKTIAIIALIAAFIPFQSFAGEGGNSGGGGSGVVLSDNSVHLVDLMTNEEVVDAQSGALKFADVIERFYKQNQFVKQAAARDPNFYSCARTVLNRRATRFPVLAALATQLQNVSVLQVQFQIITIPEGQDYANLNLPIPLISTASNRLPADRQEALATYVHDQLWVSNRLYTRMSNVDQCGLSVHESFRHLNQAHLVEDQLTQDEIEAATRFVLGYSVNPQIQSRVVGKLSHPTLTAAEYDAMAESDLLKAKSVLADLIKLGPCPLDSAGTAVWVQKANTYQREGNALTAESSHLTARAMLASLNSPGMQKAANGLAEATYYPELTTPLKDSKYVDVVNLTIVRR